ncbi:hypothetical protein ZWY2020_048372 [Hordeum vulgare]|nr:hypothetical protein ZWY2020_048372 [Hordeum vulgare]
MEVQPLSARAGAANAGNSIALMIAHFEAHVQTLMLRKSTCSTRYDGFRVPQPSDSRRGASKLKDRVKPSLKLDTNTTAPIDELSAPNGSGPAPDSAPFTPIRMMQSIGTNICGVPPTQLTPEKLSADLHQEDDHLEAYE